MGAAGFWEGGWVFVLAALLTASGFLGVSRLERRRRQMRTELTDKYQNAVENLPLETGVDELARALVGPGSAWRISIYTLDPDRACWVRQLRRSSDQTLERGGRAEISMEESFLKRLLLRDLTAGSPPVDVSGELPEPVGACWEQFQCSQFGYTNDQAKRLRMKARRYGVGAIRLEGKDGITMGVVVEVVDPDRLDRQQLERVLNRPTMVMLSTVLGARDVVARARTIVHADAPGPTPSGAK